jgi:hypothetical protein
MRTTRSRTTGCIWIVACVGLVSTLPHGLRAEEDARAQATQHFRRGVELFQAGEFEPALVEFDTAYRLRNHYPILLNMAYCYREMGRIGDAIEHFERFLSEGGTEVPRARRATVEEELQRLRALLVPLTIEVNMPGASIRVDGRDVGASPLADPVLVRAGAVHTVEARLDGYRTATREVAAAEGAPPPPVVLELESLRRTGRLAVEATVEGAQVFLDARLLGPAPWSGEVDAGHHAVEVRAERYQTARQEVDVAAGGEVALEMEMRTEGQPAQLLVDADVEGATVLLDGRQVGVTPLTLSDLPSGIHRLRVEREGYAAFDGDVTLTEGRASTARLELDETEGGISSAWFWAGLGLTLATGIGSVVTGLLTVRTDTEADDHVRDVATGINTDPPDVQEADLDDLTSRGRTLALTTDVLWIASSAFAVTTLVLAFFTRFGDPESTLNLEVGGAIGQEAALVTASGRF